MAPAPVRVDLRELIRDLLACGRAVEILSGADLFAIAYIMAGTPAILSADNAVEVLLDNGLRTGLSKQDLADRLAEGAREDRTFLTVSATSFCLDCRADVRDRVVSAFSGAPGNTIQELIYRIAARRGPSPEASKRVASRPLGGASAGKRWMQPRRAKLGDSRTAPKAAPRAVDAAAALPPPPPLVAAPVTVACFSEAELGRHLATVGHSAEALAQVRHVLAAHRLASAEHFEELISFGAMAGVELYSYQVETVRRVLRVFRGRGLLADEVGLGKTVEALLILREYQLRGMVRRALVLVPPSLLRQWAGEIWSKTGLGARTTEDPEFRDDPAAFWAAPGITVASIATARMPKHAPLVQAAAWDMVIVDEAHHVKNRLASSFKLVDGIKSRFLLLLTATPIETDLEELYNLVTLLKPGQFATPAAFRARFVDPKNPLSPKNREELRELLGQVMVRNTRADSGLALPPRYVTTLVIDPLPEEARLYEGVVGLMRDHAADGGARMLVNMLLLMAGSSVAAVRGSIARTAGANNKSPALRAGLLALSAQAADVKGSRKTEALAELARAHGERILVFTRFRDTLEHVYAALREAGVPALRFHGGQTADEKAQSLEAFRHGACVLVATDVGGEGQNLHHCRTLVNFDLPFNPMLLEQRIGRLHRMGQTSEVRVYNLCARGTAEERVLDLLDRRLHLFELVVGELDMVLGQLADERDLEERILALYAEARTAEDLDRGFDAIEAEISRARGRYEHVKALDGALFGRDFEA